MSASKNEEKMPESISLPKPTFIWVGADGALNLEWCFGGRQDEGADDSWRVMFAWDPDEGAMACKTTKDGQIDSLEGPECLAAMMLAGWLKDVQKS